MIPRSLKVAVKYLVALSVVSLALVAVAVWTRGGPGRERNHAARQQVDDSASVPIIPFRPVKGPSQSIQDSHFSYVHPISSTTSLPTRHTTMSSHHPPTTHRPPATHTHRNKSYLLALGYTEQLSAATHTMFTLGTLAADWGANMVEPFVKKSFLFGLQNVVPPEFMQVEDENTLSLFDIYNRTKVNKDIHNEISPLVSMSDFDTFLAEASPSVTLFHFATRSSKFSQRIFALNSQDTQLIEKKLAKNVTDSVVQCLSAELRNLQGIARDIDRELNSKRTKVLEQTHSLSPGSDVTEFKISRVWCLDPLKAYKSGTLRKYIPPHSTVIFTNWRGCGVRSCHYSDEEPDTPIVWKDKFRHAILTKTRTAQRLDHQHTLHHSSIEDNARLFLEKHGYSSPFVAIHVRIERLVKQSKETKSPSSYIKQCLEELTGAVQNLTHPDSEGKSLKTLLVTDVSSKYGTSTCQKGKKCRREETMQVLSRLGGLGFHPQSYDPRVTNSTGNSGYVSLVEMHMLAAGDKLVMVGFGGFQAILEDLFLSNSRSKRDIVHICHSH